jgi:hypothetical protein
MDSLFFEHKQARTFIYASIFVLWLIILLLNASSPTMKQVIFATVGYPVVGIISFFFVKLSLSSIYLFTKKIGIYQLIYWYGLLGAIVSLGTMIFPQHEMYGEASLMVIVFVTVAWVSRSAYFDFQETIKKS